MRAILTLTTAVLLFAAPATAERGCTDWMESHINSRVQRWHYGALELVPHSALAQCLASNAGYGVGLIEEGCRKGQNLRDAETQAVNNVLILKCNEEHRASGLPHADGYLEMYDLAF